MTTPAWLDGLDEVSYPDGVDILVAGTATTSMYVLVSGELRVHIDGLQVDTITRTGTVVGEMAALLGGAPRATVTTVGPCVLRRTEDPRGLMEREPGVGLAVAERVAYRLDLITAYLADLRTQYADRADHLGVVVNVLQALMNSNAEDVEPGSVREPDAPY